MRKHVFLVMAVATVSAVFFTWFYTVHETLPVWVRAPTSLLLAPVAIADGAAYALRMNGVYGSLPKVFVANWLAWASLTVSALIPHEQPPVTEA